MKKEDLICKNCIHGGDPGESSLFTYCTKNAPNGLEEKDVYGALMGHKVYKEFCCSEGEWWEWYENNRDSKSLRTYNRRCIYDLED